MPVMETDTHVLVKRLKSICWYFSRHSSQLGHGRGLGSTRWREGSKNKLMNKLRTEQNLQHFWDDNFMECEMHFLQMKLLCFDLRCFGHVQPVTSFIKSVTELAISISRGLKRPGKMWSECVKSDINECGMSSVDPQDRDAWRIGGQHCLLLPTPSNETWTAPKSQHWIWWFRFQWIDSGKDMVPSGNNPLSEPMLIAINDALPGSPFYLYGSMLIPACRDR